MDIHGYLVSLDPWISMYIHGYPWIRGLPRIPGVEATDSRKSMDICATWDPKGYHGIPWVSLDNHGYPWIFIDIWVPWDPRGVAWDPRGISEHPWTPMDIWIPWGPGHGLTRFSGIERRSWVSMDIHRYLNFQ